MPHTTTRLEHATPHPSVQLLKLAGAGLCLAAPQLASAQAQVLPFSIGERLVYRVSTTKMHATGNASLWVDGPVDMRGSNLYVLHSDIRLGVGPLKAMSSVESWLDPHRMASLRFHKTERRPLGGASEDVQLFPDTRRWEDARGRTGESPTNAPLDELSFLYFIRTLPLSSDSTYSVSRHFSADRNPVDIRVVGHEVVNTQAGSFATIVVEMRVKDGVRYDGSGVIRLNLTDDQQRLPVRIESDLPVVGTAVLNLVSFTTRTDVAAVAPLPSAAKVDALKHQ